MYDVYLPNLLNCESQRLLVQVHCVPLFCLTNQIEYTGLRKDSFYNPPPPPRTRSLGVYRDHPVCPSVCLSRVNLTLAITFKLKEIKLSYYTCVLSLRTKNLTSWPWLLTYFWKKLNLRHAFLTKRDWAFIFHVCIPCGKTFLSVPKNLTLWPWPWLYLLLKKITLALTFEQKEIRLSYYAWIFLVARLFCLYQNFYPVILSSKVDLLLIKVNIGINFWTKRDRVFILHIDIPYCKTFLTIPTYFFIPWPWPPTLTYFWKKLNFEPKEILRDYKGCGGGYKSR